MDPRDVTLRVVLQLLDDENHISNWNVISRNFFCD